MRVDFRKLVPPPSDPEHLVGVQYCELFSPRWFTWNTAQAVPLVRILSLVGPGCLAAALDLAGRVGRGFPDGGLEQPTGGRQHWDERTDNDNEVVHSTTMLLETMAAMRDEGLAVPPWPSSSA